MIVVFLRGAARQNSVRERAENVVCMYIYIYMHACMYVCMYVCMYMYIYIYI